MKNNYMRYILLTLVFLLSILRGGAQVTLGISSTEVRTILSAESYEERAKVVIKNNSSQTKKITWQRSIQSITLGWTCFVCDKNQCWPYSMNFPSNVIELAPYATTIIDVYVRPDKRAGSATLDVKVFEVGSATNNVSARFYFAASASTKDVREVVKSEIMIYPNPMTDYFMIQEGSGVEKVAVYNIIGRQMKAFKVSDGNKFYINDLPDGIYIIRLQNANGGTIKTARMTKSKPRA